MRAMTRLDARNVLVALLAVACARPSAAPVAAAAAIAAPPDRIFYNARIWTGDPAIPSATAIATRRDTIVAVGPDRAILALAGWTTRAEDLEGRFVMPGFHDAHWHLPTRRHADLTGSRNENEVAARLMEHALTAPTDAWILGRGWTPDMFPGNTAHRRHLDAAFPDRPVLITDRDGHQVLANSRALALAGITNGTSAPAGGVVVRDPDGSATGLLQEAAMALATRQLPEPTVDEIHALLVDEMRKAASHGLTALQVANGLSAAGQTAFERALARDSLLVRFRVAVPFRKDATDADLRAWTGLRDRFTGPTLRYGIAKGMLDGTVDAATAAMLAPYAVRGGTGLTQWDADTLAGVAARYDSAGLQLEWHAIGDRAIRMGLDAFASLARTNGARDRRPRIEHLEVPDPADIPRFAQLGVIASTQAIFASPDPTSLENYAPLLGPERSARAMPFRALDDAGAIQAFGSDYPVFPMDPVLGVYTAVTRQLPDGSPALGWYPQHRISAEAALRHYTADAAFAAYRERELGVLKAGMLADFVVLSAPLIGVAPAEMLKARPVLTVMGGRDTFRAR
jgi:predicted amidohydrolase YtcJ